MKFHSEFDIRRSPYPIKHTENLLLLGSCFTENIGEKLRKYKFNTLENPNGILFNPVSVAEAVHSYIACRQITEKDIFEYNETWHSWKHHSRFSGITAGECVNKINQSVTDAHQYIKNAEHLLLTLGSAWVYTLTGKATNALAGSVAANNHKAPADWFSKRLLTANETEKLMTAMLEEVLLFNPSIKIILTISPVRHLREGLVENNRSKAVLIQAVHAIVEKYEQLYYFPAYELVIDDLRDYRFYAEDLVHPNYQATQYVWEKFSEACMGDETRSLMKEIADINLAYQHKPFNAATKQHQQFLKNYLDKTIALKKRYNFLNLEEEIRYFENNIRF